MSTKSRTVASPRTKKRAAALFGLALSDEITGLHSPALQVPAITIDYTHELARPSGNSQR